MSELKVDCYEVEKYVVRVVKSGLIGEFEYSFDTEEEALNFIDKSWTIQWRDYTLIKISHAIF